MQHNGYQLKPNVSIMLDRMPPGKAGPRKVLTAELVRVLTPLDQLLPTLEGRPRRQVLLERGSSFRPTGGAWDGRQHDPESASYAGGEASKIHLREWRAGQGGMLGWLCRWLAGCEHRCRQGGPVCKTQLLRLTPVPGIGAAAGPASCCCSV